MEKMDFLPPSDPNLIFFECETYMAYYILYQ